MAGLFLSTRQACLLLHCHPNSLRRWEKEGFITSTRIGERGHRKYKKSDIEKLIKQQDPEEKSIYSAEKLQMILDSISDAVVVYDKKWRYVYLNEKATMLTGLKREQLLNKSLYELYPERTKLPIFKKFQNIMKKGKYAELEYFSPGANRWILTKFYPTQDGMTTFITDITDQKESEERARYLATLTENMVDAVISTNKAHKIVSWNSGAELLYQWKLDEVRGKNMTKVLKTVFPHEQQGRMSVYEKLAKHSVWRGEVIHTRKDGVQIPILSSIALLKDSRGVLIGNVAVNRDITELKRLEKQKEEFLAVASHELKTPVTSLKAYGQVVKNRFARKGDTNSVVLMEKMDNQINKLTTLIIDLLDVTKIQSGKLQIRYEFFDFGQLITEIVEQMQLTTKQHIVITHLGKTKKIYADRERIAQVMINFLTNAIKYSSDAKQIKVSVTYVKNAIGFSVQDFGIGIPKKKQEKIFERFYRVEGKGKDTYPGLGLGLYISAEIIKQHGGEISFKSTEGKGSIFTFTIPLIDDKRV